MSHLNEVIKVHGFHTRIRRNERGNIFSAVIHIDHDPPLDLFDEFSDQVRSLDINFEDEGIIQPRMLDSLSNLQTLSLHFKKVLEIPATLFSKLENLKTLHLSAYLTLTGRFDLHPDLFQSLSNLRYLKIYIPQNFIPLGLFSNLKNLKSLDVSTRSCNKKGKLKEVHPESMENLESIVSIGFTDTLLTSIPPNIFGSLARAKRRKMDNDPNPIEPLSIFLSHNKFATLPVSLFRPFVKYNIEIKLISLGDNKLVSLPDGIFDNLMVNELSVANNKLYKFPKTKPYDKNNDFYPGVLDIRGNKFRKDIKDYLLCDFNAYQYNTILEILGVIQAQAEN